MGVQISPGEGAILGWGMGHTIVKYREHEPSVAERWLARWRWRVNSQVPKTLCVKWRPGSPRGKGQFWGISCPLKSIANGCLGTLSAARLLVGVVAHWQASPPMKPRDVGENYFRFGLRWWCGLLSNYFDLLFLLMITLFDRFLCHYLHCINTIGGM